MGKIIKNVAFMRLAGNCRAFFLLALALILE